MKEYGEDIDKIYRVKIYIFVIITVCYTAVSAFKTTHFEGIARLLHGI